MQRTRKWKFVAEEARHLAGLRLSVGEIARKLDIDASTVRRWVKAGRLPGAKVRRRRSARAAKRRATSHAPVAGEPRSGKESKPGAPSGTVASGGRVGTHAAIWERKMLRKYTWEPTERERLRLATHALALALDESLTATQRSTCMGRFDALVDRLGIDELERDIDAEIESADETGQANVRRWPRPA